MGMVSRFRNGITSQLPVLGLRGNHSCKGPGVEANDGVVFRGAGNFDGIAANFAVFHIGLMANRKVHDHRNLFPAIRANEKVFHLESACECVALKNRLNFSVDGDVRLIEAIDGVGGPADLREMKVPADVIILVECAEDALDGAFFEAEL
jgi:hypothetical protein